jgi:hypothetical protein
MSAKCQVCGAKSNLFLCNDHLVDLRDMLTGLAQGQQHPNGQRSPGWLSVLADAAIGQTRMGDSGGGRRGRAWSERDGSADVLIKCRCKHSEHGGRPCPAVDPVVAGEEPDPLTGKPRPTFTERACSCVEYEPATTPVKLFAQSLAHGGVNMRASTLLRRVRRTLDSWVEHAETVTGVGYRPLDASDLAGQALWLAHNVRPIAGTEQAGLMHQRIKQAVDDIERTVNRPIPMRFLGPCPTWIEPRQAVCGVELYARADAVEVFCKACRQTHNCARLQLLLINDLERKKLTVDKILELNRVLPEEYRIPERTLRRWRRPGPKGEPPKLKPRGYRRPDGRVVISCLGDDAAEYEPLYLWADVRKLRADDGKVGVK